MHGYTSSLVRPNPIKNAQTSQPQPFAKSHPQPSINSQQSTHPEPSRKLPHPIQQTKITKTHQNLQQIPLPLRPQLIQQLYLSHNKIRSVKGILGKFVSLRNLNLSYNLLEHVEEFVEEILGNGQDLGLGNGDACNRRDPILLRKLVIRMNRFGYGYQDRIIKMIQSLERFEDFCLTDKNGYNPKQIFQLGSKVSQYFLPSYCHLHSSIVHLTHLYELSQTQHHPNFLPFASTCSQVAQKYEKIVSKLSAFRQPVKAPTFMPVERKDALLKVLEYEIVCIGLAECQGQRDGGVGEMFLMVFKELLMRFQARNYHHFLHTLTQQPQPQEPLVPTSTTLSVLCQKFCQLYQTRRYPIYESNPGKYLPKIDPQEVRAHPLLEYLGGNEQKQGRQGFKQKQNGRWGKIDTLDGCRRRGRNTLFRELGDFVDRDTKSQQSSKQMYQLMPIIVYQPNYLQILTQIWQQQLKAFIKIYDLTYHRLLEVQKCQSLSNSQVKFVNIVENNVKFNQDVVMTQTPLAADAYLLQDVDNWEGQNKQNYKTKEILHRQPPKQEENRKTLPKIPRKHKNQAHIMKHHNEPKQNLSSYSIYQINLAYKVLTALKKNKNKRKRRQKQSPNLNP